jgi:hypothetical protein
VPGHATLVSPHLSRCSAHGNRTERRLRSGVSIVGVAHFEKEVQKACPRPGAQWQRTTTHRPVLEIVELVLPVSLLVAEQVIDEARRPAKNYLSVVRRLWVVSRIGIVFEHFGDDGTSD